MEKVKKELLNIIEQDLGALYLEMKELDRQYIEKQKRVRQLRKAKEDVEREWSSKEYNTGSHCLVGTPYDKWIVNPIEFDGSFSDIK